MYPFHRFPQWYHLTKLWFNIITRIFTLIHSRYKTLPSQEPLMFPFYSHTHTLPSYHSPPLPLATTNLFFLSIILLFQESYTNEIIQFVIFWGWIFKFYSAQFSGASSKLLHVSLVLFTDEQYSMAAVSNLFGTRDWFHERQVFHRPGLWGMALQPATR